VLLLGVAHLRTADAKILLDWLIDLIGDVSALHEVNKMTRRNLCRCSGGDVEMR
jgi:hypothetical protein